MTTPENRPRKVLVTGAGGYIASLLLPHLLERYELRLLDIHPVRFPGIVDVRTADLAVADRSGLGDVFAGIDVVVHLGYVRSSPAGVYDETVPHIERFEAEMANVRMAYNVYRCALENGVRRVVIASSNHAADWYEHALVHGRRMEMVGPDDLPLSDNFYGWAKAAYELLGFPFASGTFGRRLEVVLIRIGSPREVESSAHIGRDAGPSPSVPGGTAGLKRELGAYMSVADGRQIFTRAIETDDITNEHGVPWLVVYGISGNTRAFWSLESARRTLGFDPQDDSEIRFADQVAMWLTGSTSNARGGRLG